jgi:hypothetical protein
MTAEGGGPTFRGFRFIAVFLRGDFAAGTEHRLALHCSDCLALLDSILTVNGELK